MSAGTRSRAWWLWATVSAGCTAVLLFAGAQVDGWREPVAHTAAYRPIGVTPSPDMRARPAYAGRARVFGLVTPGPDPSQVLFAPARRMQPGGPETVYPGDAESYQALPLASDAKIRVTAPIALEALPDYVHGVSVSEQRFPEMYREADERYGPFLDRGHMFDLWFDDQGHIVRMQQIFSP